MLKISKSNFQHILALTALIFAGEMIFSLPFHIARFFRPTFLQVFSISNTQLGDVFAAYGVIAMLSYFPGGMIADKYSVRKLMSFSLLATSLGGFYFYTLPSISGLYILFAYWGLTSILLFWAALIKATRDWGGQQTQGMAFGLLDGGRGLVASVFASIAVLILSWALSDLPEEITQQRQAMQSVIIFYTFATFLASVFIWFFLPKKSAEKAKDLSVIGEGLFSVFKNSTVWLQAGVVVIAYCGYKALDNYGIYASQVLGMSSIESAEFTAFASYTRPLAAITAGLLVDRWRASRLVITLFALVSVVFFALSVVVPGNSQNIFIMANLLISFVAVYALRGVYFTLLEESQVDAKMTGTAVGVISAVGYTPDIFFAPITGRILDANHGLIGFQNYFLTLGFMSVAGLICAILLARKIKASARTIIDS